MGMKAHGRWQVTRLDNTVVQTNIGSTNREGVLATFADIKAAMPRDTDWAVLVNSLHWEMSPVDALTTIGQCRQWMFEHRCVRHAIVVQAGLRQKIHAHHAATLPSDPLQYFSNLHDACAWLTQCGFPISPADYPHQKFIDSATVHRG